MIIHWINGTSNKVKERVENCDQFGSIGFYATTEVGTFVLCIYTSIKYIEFI